MQTSDDLFLKYDLLWLVCEIGGKFRIEEFLSSRPTADPFTAIDGYKSTGKSFIEIQSCFNRKFIRLLGLKVALQLAHGPNFFIIAQESTKPESVWDWFLSTWLCKFLNI